MTNPFGLAEQTWQDKSGFDHSRAARQIKPAPQAWRANREAR
jgi:hypothetical protein